MKGGTRVKMKWLQLLMILVLLVPIKAMAQTKTQIDKLDEISDEALQLVKYEKYDDAKKMLDYFSKQFESDSGNVTLDQLRIVTMSHDEAVEATVSPNMKYEERMNKLTAFRLVMDAISTKHQPLWTGMEDQIMTKLQHLKKDIQKNDPAEFNNDFNSFLSLYNIIYPSMKIDVPAETIEQLDARISVIDSNPSQVLDSSKNSKELDGLESDFKKIFDDMDEDQSDPSIWWVIISTGSIIIMTLSYVGYRKYQGEKVSKNRSREQKH